MIKRAPRPGQGFLILRNEVARDARLSYRARGLLAAILSRPDNWTANAEQLASEAEQGEGVKAVRTALNELEKVGYLKRQRIRGADGRFRWVQTVYDVAEPSPEHRSSVLPGQTTSPKPPDGFPPDGFRRSKEEPRRSTEEEDVTELSCPASGRFAPSSGREFEDPELIDDEAPTGREIADWRTEDRALFKEIVGDRIATNGALWKPAGTHKAELWYDAFRKNKENPIRWPGRFFASLDGMGSGVDDWLIAKGMERAA